MSLPQSARVDRWSPALRLQRLSARMVVHAAVLLLAATALAASLHQPVARAWLPGDSHVHSHWSPGYDTSTSPPTPIRGGDALYPTPLNAHMARRFGLEWMVTTDHGGPNHSKLNATRA